MWQSLGDFDLSILHTYPWYLQKVALKYEAAKPIKILKTINRILNSILNFTGSQCKSTNKWVMRQYLLSLQTIRVTLSNCLSVNFDRFWRWIIYYLDGLSSYLVWKRPFTRRVVLTFLSAQFPWNVLMACDWLYPFITKIIHKSFYLLVTFIHF